MEVLRIPKGKQVRQGDVILFPCSNERAEQIKKNGKKITGRPLAFGEVTGHSHAILEPPTDEYGKLNYELYELGDDMLLTVNKEGGISLKGITLTHEDHGTPVSIETGEKIQLAPGANYEVHIGEEYNPEKNRRLMD